MNEPIGYLVSQYPALSHTFVEREILAMRDLGVRISTFSVRRPDSTSPFTPTTLEELAATEVLQGQPMRRYLCDVGRLFLRSPHAVWSGLKEAGRSGPRTPKGRIWQFFYLLEALHLLRRMQAASVRHLHVHHANNAADVARLVVAMGNALHPAGPTWTWSLALHGPTEFLDPDGHDLPRKLRSAHAVACISEYARRTALEIAPDAAHERFGIVRMSAPADLYAPLGAVRAGRTSPVSILFVGRLVEDKSPDLLVEAVRMLLDDGLQVRATIAGDGPLRMRIEEQVRSTGLAGAVAVVGAVSQTDLPDLYGAADIFCLPSAAEGVPVVLMEAMLTELPVVSTTVAGIPELVDQDSGVLVQPNDVASLVAALRSLIDRPEDRLRLGRHGRRAVLRRHDAHENAVRLRALLAT